MSKRYFCQLLEMALGPRADIQKMTEEIWTRGIYECPDSSLRVGAYIEIRQITIDEFSGSIPYEPQIHYDQHVRTGVPINQLHYDGDPNDLGAAFRGFVRRGLVQCRRSGSKYRYQWTKKGRAFKAGEITIPCEDVVIWVLRQKGD